MSLLGIDIGGTKAAFALFDSAGNIIRSTTAAIAGRGGSDAASLIRDGASMMAAKALSMNDPVTASGVSVPGISRRQSGTVWAPNIVGWDDYPLHEELSTALNGIPVSIESDRACYIAGEAWRGNALGCSDAVFIAVGTGIGAGIMINGEILHGSNDIAGATGWMALDRPFMDEYRTCGCFEYYASGEGIARQARAYADTNPGYRGALRTASDRKLTSHDVFSAWEKGDEGASYIIGQAVAYWGMAAANFVSLFNPEKIIFGGGVFGPGVRLIPLIKEEAAKWAQPIAMKQVTFEPSALGGEAGVYGAAFLALKRLKQ